MTLGDGDVWLDTGTIASYKDAIDYVHVVQTRTGKMIGSPEVVAHQQGFIDEEALHGVAEPLKKSGYGHNIIAHTKKD
jgi:glucose-1-phosphate thymidylyltransferase